VLEEAIRLVRPDSAHFWATHSGAELDLLLQVGGVRYGVEAKYQDAPSLTRSMQSALADLRLGHLTVLYPGTRQYSLEPRVTVVPVSALATRGRAAILTPRR
jgi:hypothetical protein